MSKIEHSYASTLTDLGSPVRPMAIQQARLVTYNQELADSLNLPALGLGKDDILGEIFSESGLLAKHAFAQKYGGHQFGHWNPDLGDGRGLLLAEIVKQKQRTDLHLKGAGPTPYSRFADGRAVLRSTIREYLASEALHHLGIPSSRALCLLDSTEPVYREKQEKAAMMIRTCPSHLRFGHFEYFFHSKQPDKLDKLFSYCFDLHFSDCKQAPKPHLAMLLKIIEDTAIMIAKWQAIGFNHGVMNTDNMSIHGITFDFGPFAFLDDFEPGFICNHSDHGGRYAFDRQPGIALWNLNALAHAFSPYLDNDEIQQALETYETILLEEYTSLLSEKLGLLKSAVGNQDIVNPWLSLIAQDKRDYTLSFRLLCEFDMDGDNTALVNHFIDRDRITQWIQAYGQLLRQQGRPQVERQKSMRKVNPLYILRNYIAQLVIDDAEQGDYDRFHMVLKMLSTPFDHAPQFESYAQGPPVWGKHMEISCSS